MATRGDGGQPHYLMQPIPMPQPPPLPNLPGYDLVGSRGTGAPHGRGRENVAPRLGQSLTYRDGKPYIADQEHVYQPVNLQQHSWVGDAGYNPYLQQQQQQQQQAPAMAQRATKRGPREGEVLSETQAAFYRQGVPSTMQWTGKKTPGWLMYDKKVLHFFATVREMLQNNPHGEQARTRRYHIRYFMEDDSIEVTEPVEENSGLVQGRFLHRHKVKLADGEVLKWDRLRVGEAVTLYGRTFHIVGCDSATRELFRSRGMELPPDEAPEPPKDQEAEGKPKAPSAPGADDGEELDPLHVLKVAKGPQAVFDVQYENPKLDLLDRKVLRFFCCWYDHDQLANNGRGFRIPLALHCYPVDDTVEMVEIRRPNDGRDPFPILLKRCKLPKTPNVPPVGGRPLSPRTRRMQNITYFSWRDLRVGSMIKVYGRDVLLHDCDASTKQFYQEFASLPDSAFKPVEVDFDMSVRRPPLHIPTDQLGIGSEEDSLRNVLNLIPKRKPVNYNNYLENFDKVLRFRSRMVLLPGQREFPSPHDGVRRFILSFFPLDDTIAIFEPKQPNSGLLGGTFLERTKVYKPAPGGLSQDSSKRQPIAAPDVFVGAVISVFSRGFELVEADEKTLTHMEENPELFPLADYGRVLSRVQQQLSPQAMERVKDILLARDQTGTGLVNAQQVKEAMQAVGLSLLLHEALTLIRGQSRDGQSVSMERLFRELGYSAGPRAGLPRQGPPPGGYVGGDERQVGDAQQQQQQQMYQQMQQMQMQVPPAAGAYQQQQQPYRGQQGPPQQRDAYRVGQQQDQQRQRQSPGAQPGPQQQPARGGGAVSSVPSEDGSAASSLANWAQGRDQLPQPPPQQQRFQQPGLEGVDLAAMAPAPRRAWEQAQQEAWQEQQQSGIDYAEIVQHQHQQQGMDYAEFAQQQQQQLVTASAQPRVHFADVPGEEEPDEVSHEEHGPNLNRRQYFGSTMDRQYPGAEGQQAATEQGGDRRIGQVLDFSGGQQLFGARGQGPTRAHRSHSFREWADDDATPQGWAGSQGGNGGPMGGQRNAASEGGAGNLAGGASAAGDGVWSRGVTPPGQGQVAGMQSRSFKQPQSLWQTTNNALGGIYHRASHQSAPKAPV